MGWDGTLGIGTTARHAVKGHLAGLHDGGLAVLDALELHVGDALPRSTMSGTESALSVGHGITLERRVWESLMMRTSVTCRAAGSSGGEWPLASSSICLAHLSNIREEHKQIALVCLSRNLKTCSCKLRPLAKKKKMNRAKFSRRYLRHKDGSQISFESIIFCFGSWIKFY